MSGTKSEHREPRAIFVIRLEGDAGRDGIRALQGILKILLRRYGWRCLDIREEPPQ